MNRYKQELDAVHAPDALKETLASMQKETVKPKPVKKWIAAAAAVFVVLLAGTISVPTFMRAGSAAKSAPQESYDTAAENVKEYSYTSDSIAPAGVALTVETAQKNLPAGRKLIRDAGLNVETKDFDTFHQALNAKVAALGGYTESSDIGNRSDRTRYATIVLRVPSESLDTLLQDVAALGTVTWQSTSIQDVTDEYIDTESRVAAVQTEQETLLALLKKAESLTDTLEIQNRLTEVRASLETYKGQLKALDSQINYSKVTLEISEVERVTSPESKSFFGEVRGNLSDNLYSIGQSARSIAIWTLSSLPYFGILLVLAGIVILIVRLVRKHRK